MHLELLDLLVCPECSQPLKLESTRTRRDDVEEGRLSCPACAEQFPIRRGIPRFAGADAAYVENFSWQWARFNRTQLDEFNGTHESERRFRAETGWQPADLKGWLVLDAGCGAGRFTAVASAWQARVVAVDLAAGATEACAQNMRELGRAETVDVVQASLYRLPFRPGSFDAVFSLGVLQHTPDPQRAMRLLPTYLKPGGRLAYWIYERRWYRVLMLRNHLRSLTRRLPVRLVQRLSVALVAVCFPVTLLMSRLPGIRKLVPLVPISARHYWGRLSLREQWEWTVLDTIDSYAAAHEYTQRAQDVVAALQAAGIRDTRRTPARGMAIVGTKAPNG